ncbi:MAG: hypothetical protein L3J32_09635, partial [Rhizobiaceae bacterium]|nr:hypothetical protein [Rhizobiaceae bacterium]
FSLSGRTYDWDGYKVLWARAQNGCEGWVPNDLPARLNSKTIASYDYCAQELDVMSKERLEVLRQSHGWAWCINSSRKKGWIPQKVLKPC